MEYFFARPMGAEGASPQRAKAALARMIQGEDPRRPLSDRSWGNGSRRRGCPWPAGRWPSTAGKWDCPRPIAGGGEEEAQKEPSQTMAGLLF